MAPNGEPFEQWPTHLLRYGRLVDPVSKETLDKMMAVFMEAPRTFTGEDVVELHLHGSPVLADLSVRLATEAGARLARPGEFTQRAFLNGKLDLTQAESVLDLIDSRTKEQARLAAQHLDGRFSVRIGQLRAEVLQWLAFLEAEIDFGDEIDNLPEAAHRERLKGLTDRIEALLSDAEQGRLTIQGLQTVLIGAPNAGKSSFLNALLGEDRALVTPIAGTTRDRIEVDCQIDGVLFNLIDTAGLRNETDDQVEVLGMEKTREALGRADLTVLLVDSVEGSLPELDDFHPDVVFLNKKDLGVYPDLPGLQAQYPKAKIQTTEMVTEEGRDEAVSALVAAAKTKLTDQAAECFSLNQRHRASLLQAKAGFDAIEETLNNGLGAEFIALDLRRSAESLGEILGLDITEEVLDRIFGQFCLGK